MLSLAKVGDAPEAAVLGESEIPALPNVDKPPASTRFQPKAPSTIEESGLPEALVEALVFKVLLAAGNITSRDVARATALPGKPILDLLATLKMKNLVHFKDKASTGDFEYALTDAGRLRAAQYMEECSYVGPAPITLETYIQSVAGQGITTVHPKREDLQKAFGDLLIDEKMLQRLGPAINSGRGLFLYGASGNGKSSIAERITNCFGDSVWVPYAILCSGELITFFDPEAHEVVESPRTSAIDPRWVKIRRPTIVVGGELTLEALDLSHDKRTKVTSPSLQLKSNTGTLVIDDFGRQRVRPLDLLNRWVVPLEKRFDYLSLATGKKVQVPFDQLIIFATNLEPKDLVDEAFLRRIPYKIQIVDPTEEEFRKLFDLFAPRVGVELAVGAVDYLLRKHYKAADRPFRSCQPRDLLQQIRNSAVYRGEPLVATPASFDAACDSYFGAVL